MYGDWDCNPAYDRSSVTIGKTNRSDQDESTNIPTMFSGIIKAIMFNAFDALCAKFTADE
jgi:hypothetical protein